MQTRAHLSPTTYRATIPQHNNPQRGGPSCSARDAQEHGRCKGHGRCAAKYITGKGPLGVGKVKVVEPPELLSRLSSQDKRSSAAAETAKPLGKDCSEGMGVASATGSEQSAAGNEAKASYLRANPHSEESSVYFAQTSCRQQLVMNQAVHLWAR